MSTITNGLGRRKSAVARVYLSAGTGKVVINNRDYKEYFTVPHLSWKVIEPLKILGVEAQYDVKVNVSGGGVKGQVEAIMLGVARALVKINEENKPPLKARNMMTRDPRAVERKKFGQKKARKSFQFSKR
jgi:small subunit ribosomal protein S9